LASGVAAGDALTCLTAFGNEEAAVLVAELHAWATCGLELLEIRTLRLYDATRMKIPGFKFRDKD